jgi:CSLREA domain-containing protein
MASPLAERRITMLRPHRHALAGTLLLAALAAAAPALGRVYVITTTADDAEVNGNCTLREAIRAARDDAFVDQCWPGEADDVIVLLDGTYPFDGAETISGNISLAISSLNVNPAATIIDLQAAGRFLHLTGTGAGGYLTMSGLQIRNGSADGSGGAIYAARYALVLHRMSFRDNGAFDGGGAVYFNSSGAPVPLQVYDTLFADNAARHRGGAVWAILGGGGRFEDVTFESNTVFEVTGGGAAWGGGLMLATPSFANAVLDRCRFVLNAATTTSGTFADQARGGGAFLQGSGGSVFMEDTVFLANSANVAADDMGTPHSAAFAAVAYSNGLVDLDRVFVDLSHNSYATGGADVEVQATLNGRVKITNAQVTFGSTNGLRVFADGGFVDLGHLTVADYPGTGAVFATATAHSVLLNSSLFALNGADTAISGLGINSNAPNCIGLGGTFPGFVEPATGNYRLAAGSAAIDATFQSSLTLAYDRDHGQRTIGGAPDCGAYEHGALFADGFEEGSTRAFAGTSPL